MSKNFYLDAEWKRWIAENVLLGGDPEGMTKILVSKGFDEEHSRLEVDAARVHPYVTAPKAIVQQLRKREWVLHNSRMLREAVDCSIAEIWNSIDNATFFRNYYAINRPVIIRGGASKWPAVQLWNEEYLISKAGHREVQIQSGRNSDTRYEINASTHREVLTFADFVTRVFRAGETNDFYMTAQNSDINGRVNLKSSYPCVSKDSYDLAFQEFGFAPTAMQWSTDEKLKKLGVGSPLDYSGKALGNVYPCGSIPDPEGKVFLAGFRIFSDCILLELFFARILASVFGPLSCPNSEKRPPSATRPALNVK